MRPEARKTLRELVISSLDFNLTDVVIHIFYYCNLYAGLTNKIKAKTSIPP